MTQNTKRLLALLLALVLCAALFPAAAFAEGEDEDTGTIAPAEEPAPEEDPAEEPDESTGSIAFAPDPEDPELLPPEDEQEEVYSGACGDNLTWSYDEETGVLTITGTGDMWDWSPAPWHGYSSSIRTVVLPAGVTGIGNSAFYHCTSLTSVEIPEGVTSIGNYAFCGCSALTSVTIPEGVTGIGNSVFKNCTSLTSVTIPEGVTYIGDSAFYYCYSLTSVTLPESLTSIGNYAFDSCSSLTSVEIPEGVTVIWGYAFYGCRSLTSVTLPESLTDIGWYAFYNCGALTSVTLPGGVTSIGESAFSGCSALTRVYFDGCREAAEQLKGNGWATVGNDPLFNATWEYAKTLEDGWALCGGGLGWQYDAGTRTLTIMGSGPMWNFDSDTQPWKDYIGKLADVHFEPGITRIGSGAFSGCTRLRSIEIPEGVTSIGRSAFQRCEGLTSVTLPAGVTSIGESAFEECTSLTSVTIPEGVTSIEYHAFYGCSSLTSVTIPEGVTDIGRSAFEGCYDLTSVTIPAGVTSIRDYAFYCCYDLTSVTIPDSVTSIGDFAFMNCDSLKAVYIHDVAAWCAISFSSHYANPLYYASNLYLNGILVTDLVIPEGVTCISWHLFDSCSSLTSVTIPESVTSVGSEAFRGCTNLKKVIFRGGPPDIASDSFSGVTAKAYCPDDGSWWEDDKLDYGGNLTWVSYTPPFIDVAKNKYYYNAVHWAYDHDPRITGGTGDGTTFSPNAPCTREQIVTFLWAACGSPEPTSTSSPFKDVKAKHYFYKAVLWAVENGITGGTPDGKFGVGQPCTREQAMTFLWKAAGAPEPTTASSPFSDVKAKHYFCKPVLWAVENGITSGAGNGKFGVGQPCTRAQIVTFLYQAKDFLEP